MEGASFSSLRELHEAEQSSIAKVAYGLTHKALHPSNLERQNVRLALKVFSGFVSAALRIRGEELRLEVAEGTAQFIDVIVKWWDIVNVKSPHKGQGLRNVWQEPEPGMDDEFSGYSTFEEDPCRAPSDPENKCYLLLLDCVLAEVQRVNKCYQAEKQDPMKLFEDLMLLVKSTAAKVSLPTSRYDVLTVNINEYLDPNPYFGHRFETALRDACLPRDDENELRLRARRFIVELFNQLRQRLPENIQCLQKASLLSIEHALKATQEPITELAAQFLSVEAMSACETQWRNLRHVKWCRTDTTNGFWAEVGSYRDAHGDNPFAELDTLAMTVLSLPFSNAGVERCFSDMSIVKSKRRNRMNIYTLNALLTPFGGQESQNILMSFSSPGQGHSPWLASLPVKDWPLDTLLRSGDSYIPVALVPTNGGFIPMKNPKVIQVELQKASSLFQKITEVRQFGRGSILCCSADQDCV
ncbi:hypothetical protein HPB51_020570 [Rhipicephalus microplus]|uniref:Transposable element P transposase-like GTP-binding insertion domain-containing protein n=1 Tax=Rhipicephalus microplus TaxID=6941 RepID=A0A9J6DWM2_RHIMP|nr:hypothetical protein HPB51_020570 [Rhipicephalus microplus]